MQPDANHPYVFRPIAPAHVTWLIVRAVMLNDQNIYEYVLRDDMFVDMVGILECELLFET